MNKKSKHKLQLSKIKRRDFLKNTSFLGFGTLTAFTGLISPFKAKAQNKNITTVENNRVLTNVKSKVYKWRLVLAVPKTIPIWGDEVIRLAKQIKTLSGNRLQIKVYGAGELVPAHGVFDAVKNGKVEMGHAASYYWMGKLPAASFFTTVPFGMNSSAMSAWFVEGDGLKLWRKLYAPYNIVPLPCGFTNTQMGGWFKKPIKNKQSFKGLKMRIPGLGGHVLSRMGANTLLIPGGEIFTNLTTGVLDATEWIGPYHDYIMGFHKAAKYYYYPGWHEPAAQLELLIHKKNWDSLPKDLQALVKTACLETQFRISPLFAAKDAIYLQKIKKRKVKVLPFPQDVLKECYKQSLDVIRDIGKTDKLSEEIYNSYTKFQKTTMSHYEISNFSYNKAFYSIKKS